MSSDFADRRDIGFWLRSSIDAGEELLRATEADIATMREMFAQPVGQWGSYDAKTKAAHERSDRAKYNFVTSLGMTVRRLEALAPQYPEFEAAWQKAEHTRTEAKNLRDMIEHADDYLAGKGRKQGDFIRKSVLPSGSNVAADATSVIVTDDGPILGNRLNVRKVVEELKTTLAAAPSETPPPTPRRANTTK